MSFDHVKMVRAITGLSATQKLILFDLAGRADDNGYCWPSIQTIMRDTSIGNRRTVWSNLAILQEKKLICVEKIDGRRNEYFLTLENGFEPGAKKDRVQKCTRYKSAPGVGAEVHPDQVQKCTSKIPLSNQEDTISLSTPLETEIDAPENQESGSTQKAIREDKNPPCPYQAIVALYHKHLPHNPRVKVLSEARKGNMRARWTGEIVDRLKEMGKEASADERLAYLENCLKQAGASEFLTGKKAFADGRPFWASLEFLMTQSKFIKLIEGAYDNRRAS